MPVSLEINWCFSYVTFPNKGKVFYLSTRKLLVSELSWVKGFSVTILSLKWNSPVHLKRVWFGLFWKAFRSFQTWYSSRFSAYAHRHQVPFGLLSFKQVGLRFYSPLEGLDQHHLSVGCEDRLLRHPALPLVHQLSLVRTFWYLLWSFIYICLRRSHDEENRHEI